MDHDDEATRINAGASLQLIVGLLGMLRAKGIISSPELETIFDSALVGAEQSPQWVPSEGVRRLLESVAKQLAALPVLLTAPGSLSEDKGQDPS